jgi:hypothetical protein
MEQALRQALRGVAPPAPTAATMALGSQDSTSVLGGGTSATRAIPPQRRRRLEPLHEEPRTPSPAPAPVARRGGAPERPAAARRRNRGLRWFVALVLVLVAAVGGLVAYSTLGGATGQRVERKPVDRSANLDRSVQELRDLINNNTR